METIDPLMTIAAPAGISGSAFCTVKSVPFTLIPKYLSKCASVTCSSGTNSPPPALAKRMSRRPFCCLMASKRRSRSARFATSLRIAVMLLPISFTAASSSAWRRPVMKTYAPSATNRFAVARPMPLLPPVTRAIFPESLFVFVFMSLVRFLGC